MRNFRAVTMNIDRFNGLHRSMPEARSALYERFSSSEADGTNLVLQIKLVCRPQLAGKTLSYSVKFGLLPATSLRNANLF